MHQGIDFSRQANTRNITEMKSTSRSQTLACYLLLALMCLSAAFKLFRFGPSHVFWAYPLPNALLVAVPWLELLGGAMMFVGARKVTFRAYGGLVLIPILLGAVGSHIVFGWLKLFGGTSEPFSFSLASIIIAAITIWVAYRPIRALLQSTLKVA